MILFIGNFLSKHKGTISPSEQVAGLLAENGAKVHLASTFMNRPLRLTDMLWKSLFFPYRTLHVDVFSGKSLRFAECTAAIGRLRGKKVMLTLHGGRLPEVFTQSPDRFRRLFAKADHVATPSRLLQNFFKAQGFDIGLLPNFIQLDAFPFSVKDDSPPSLLWVRAFSEIYNPWLAVETLSILEKSYPGIRLTMVGPDMGDLQKTLALVRSKGLENRVDISGPCQNNELAAIYQNHSVLLNTTRYESFGVSLMEAAACGLPVVSTSVGEIPLLWEHGKDMLLVEKPDPEAMAQQVKRLLDDPAFRLSIAGNARKKSEAYDWSIIGRRWNELLAIPQK